ncbi:hypothetical protein BJF92_17420 [Rhizobium rhizosphaerae]|uniref:Uncharacterized protein n=1 Tax=Xaviernesmea rhizosphaerae TaxID=1672749 RepID=A0A1Q9AIY4_9HYPH|nr:hypothetical protein [Xaviernesmea rhizosphaerae]OLP55168.1 hypothetical protein BJF92_17420 [Xaviernesmea rhizosphaerae]OQP83253.1 hypothetical protein BTR14_22610 [Xaviernesmea rhizosphaerae]
MEKHVVTVAGEAVGVLVPCKDDMQFVAVKLDAWDLDGRLYPSRSEAERQIRQHVALIRRERQLDFGPSE